jgi:putative ABC transport system substrate-binding protein
VAALKPDVFLATNTQMVEALRQQASNTPIIFVQVPDPVGSGFVASLARPGGNITGFINFDASIGSKWLALLTEITRLKSVGVLLHAGNPTAKGYLQAITSAATTAGVEVVDANAFEPADIAKAFDDFARRKVDAVIVPPSAMAAIYLNSITSLSLTQRIPTLSTYREFVTAGGLMYYGYDRAALYEQAADYVDRILRGTKASQLPVQAPNKYELVINLATAKAMNLSVSDKMMALADEIIE